MKEYFKRQIELWGEKRQANLAKKSILIVGCGGLGSSLGFSLGASGIGEIHLVDFDRVSLHNIHRQIAFTIEDEGALKAEVLKKCIQDRYDKVVVHTHTDSFDAFVKQDKVKVDLIIDATDNLPTRVNIDLYAKTKKTPWIYGSVEAFHGQVCFFERSGFNAFNVQDRKPEGIAAPIVMHIASLQANLALRYLVGLPIKKDYLYYLYFDEEGELRRQAFLMPV
ncbi:MAG: ThiF family adenylyltransferase [Campylobacteraceae bacterium]|nr:ThiF family adenylyltransferase [Campylobacteraceae bacterium]